MEIFIWLLVAAVASAAPPNLDFEEKAAKNCNAETCALPNCRCASVDIPGGLKQEETPQFVFLTFDDAVTAANYEIYKSLFYGKKNPDGCQVAATYFMSHEYSDYSKVHDLYVHNQEISLHSISHSPLTTYWKDISLEDLKHEFGDEKKVISHFAKIPEDAIKGMRMPFLQLSGNNSFKVAKELDIKFDCSWPTQTYMKPGLWPYTLDFLSPQDCPVGPCPNESIPGVWVVPMIDWVDQKNVVCAMVDSCVNIPTDVDELVEWYKENFNREYKGNKAPFGFYVHAAWFSLDPSHLPAYTKFVEYLQSLPDVYIVGIDTALKWIQNPVPIGSPNWPVCPKIQDSDCNAHSCELKNENGEYRYMTVCTLGCPAVYPWLNNPLGENKR